MSTYARPVVPTTWEQVRDIVDSLDGTGSRASFEVDPWHITAKNAEVFHALPVLADYVQPVSAAVAASLTNATLDVHDVADLTEDQMQAYIRAVQSWHIDVTKDAREVAAALILQAIYAAHHRPSRLLPVDEDEYADATPEDEIR